MIVPAFTRGWLVIVAGLFAPLVARGELISYDGFAYTVAAGLTGQNGGTGWGSGAWSANSAYVVVPGLTFGSYPVQGNAIEVTGTVDNTQYVANRRVASTVNPSTLWVSYLYKPTVVENNNFNSVQVNTSTSGVLASRLRSGNRIWDNSLGGVQVSGSFTNANDGFDNGTTYLVVAKFDGLGSGPISARWWGLTEANYASILQAGGPTEARLDSTAFTQAVQLSQSLSYTFDTSKYVQLQFVKQSAGTQTFQYDELRHGTDLLAVVPVPEPAVVLPAVLGLGLLVVARRTSGSGV
jgi:hypothetical protein